MEEIKNIKISHPSNKLWFICWDDSRVEIKANGSIEVRQVFETPWIEIDYFDTEELWKEALLENGIDIEDLLIK